MLQGTQGIVRLVLSLVAAVVLTVLLCRLKERLDRHPGPDVLPMAQVGADED